jgi:hypothetical protein
MRLGDSEQFQPGINIFLVYLYFGLITDEFLFFANIKTLSTQAGCNVISRARPKLAVVIPIFLSIKENKILADATKVVVILGFRAIFVSMLSRWRTGILSKFLRGAKLIGQKGE